MVTHEMEVIKNLCDSVAVMANGIVEASGSVEQVFLERPPALCSLLGETPMSIECDEVLFDIQIDAMEGESLLLTRMARLLDVDFKLEDNQKLLLKDKTVSTFRIIAQKKDASLIRDFLTKEGAVYKHFPEVIA